MEINRLCNKVESLDRAISEKETNLRRSARHIVQLERTVADLRGTSEFFLYFAKYE